MARTRDHERRNAILATATRLIAAQGLGAPTAMIAREAGISNGSLFTYFDSKAALLDQLYLELKDEWAAATLADVPRDGAVRERLRRAWSGWLRWAADHPAKRRALMHLNVADAVTAASRETARAAMAGVAALLEDARAGGPMRDAPPVLVATLTVAIAEATVDLMTAEPTDTEAHGNQSFDALWRMLTGE